MQIGKNIAKESKIPVTEANCWFSRKDNYEWALQGLKFYEQRIGEECEMLVDLHAGSYTCWKEVSMYFDNKNFLLPFLLFSSTDPIDVLKNEHLMRLVKKFKAVGIYTLDRKGGEVLYHTVLSRGSGLRLDGYPERKPMAGDDFDLQELGLFNRIVVAEYISAKDNSNMPDKDKTRLKQDTYWLCDWVEKSLVDLFLPA